MPYRKTLTKVDKKPQLRKASKRKKKKGGFRIING